MQALEPDGLRKYFEAGKLPNFKKSKVSQKKGQTDEQFAEAEQAAEQKDYETKIIPFRIYKTWLLAMITKNKEQMSDYTEEVAKAILNYRLADKKGSTKRANIVETELFATKSKRGFLDALAKLIPDVLEETLPVLKDLKERVHLMNSDEFQYLVVLLKFDYAYQERINDQK